MMIEYPDADERRRALQALAGIEDAVFLEIEGQPRAVAIADEDLERSNEQKTAAVHFLRFEVGSAARGALERGARLTIGVDHPRYAHTLTAPDELRAALASDLASS
jgi:hypothetical protein